MGAFIDDPYAPLERSDKHRRHVKFRMDYGIDSDALSELIRSAYIDR